MKKEILIIKSSIDQFQLEKYIENIVEDLKKEYKIMIIEQTTEFQVIVKTKISLIKLENNFVGG